MKCAGKELQDLWGSVLAMNITVPVANIKNCTKHNKQHQYSSYSAHKLAVRKATLFQMALQFETIYARKSTWGVDSQWMQQVHAKMYDLSQNKLRNENSSSYVQEL
jgi:hypothetical protein